MKSKKEKATIVSKGWGHEVIFVNNDKYCGKLLNFTAGKSSVCTIISLRTKPGM